MTKTSCWQKWNTTAKSPREQKNLQSKNYKLTYSTNFNKLIKLKLTQPSSLSLYNKTKVYKLTCKECPKFDILNKQADNLLTDS